MRLLQLFAVLGRADESPLSSVPGFNFFRFLARSRQRPLHPGQARVACREPGSARLATKLAFSLLSITLNSRFGAFLPAQSLNGFLDLFDGHKQSSNDRQNGNDLLNKAQHPRHPLHLCIRLTRRREINQNSSLRLHWAAHR